MRPPSPMPSTEADWLVVAKRAVVAASSPAMIPVVIPAGHEETLKEQFHSVFRANRM